MSTNMSALHSAAHCQLLMKLADILAAGAPPGTKFRVYEQVRLSDLTGSFPFQTKHTCLPAVLCRNRDVLLAVASTKPCRGSDEHGEHIYPPLSADRIEALRQNGLFVLKDSELLKEDEYSYFDQADDVWDVFGDLDDFGKSRDTIAADFCKRLVDSGCQPLWESPAWHYHPVVIPNTLWPLLRVRQLLNRENTVTEDGRNMGLCYMWSLAGDPEPKEEGDFFLCCAPEKWDALWNCPDPQTSWMWKRIPLQERWGQFTYEGHTFPGYFARDIYQLMDFNLYDYMYRPYILGWGTGTGAYDTLLDGIDALEEAFGDMKDCTYGQVIRAIDELLSDPERDNTPQVRDLMRALLSVIELWVSKEMRELRKEER